MLIFTHHTLDVHPNPKDQGPHFINEPWLIDNTLLEFPIDLENPGKPEAEPDNIRIYLPMDLNKTSILRRLHYLIFLYGEANEENEMSFSVNVNQLISHWTDPDIFARRKETGRYVARSAGSLRCKGMQSVIKKPLADFYLIH